jgi:uncharacterized protein with FMN-binding domain
MRVRLFVTVLATVVGLILLVSFRTPAASTLNSGVALPPPASSPSPSSSPPAATQSGAPPAGGNTPTPTPSASGLKSGSFTGQDFPNQYGDVQIQVVVSGGKITDVQALQYPTDRPESAYISSQALPLLRQQVLQAQSAQIDGVGGATFTSESYDQSLQSALSQAGV